MPRDYLRTSDLARAAGVHPNTVRRYADWGWLPPVERTPAGYRRFTQRHLDCLRLAKLVYISEYAGRTIRQSSAAIIPPLRDGDLPGAQHEATRHLALVHFEQAQADHAATVLEQWAGQGSDEPDEPVLQIGQAAGLLGVTVDMLRNWERDGLIAIPRDPYNGYRRIRPKEISRLRIIRMLSRAGYSHMAMLRMFLQHDQGQIDNLRQALDTPRPDEEFFGAADRLLSALAAAERTARRMIDLLDEIVAREEPLSSKPSLAPPGLYN